MNEIDPIRIGSPELAEWLRTHPNPIVLRARFNFPDTPEAASVKQRAPEWPRELAGRPWPADRCGRPWPRNRWGNPSCPLDEYPPGVAAPGTAPCDPFDANSPWFDPVLALQKLGFLPADLSRAVRYTEQDPSAPTATVRPVPTLPRNGEIAALSYKRQAAEGATASSRRSAREAEHNAAPVLATSETEGDRSVGSTDVGAYPDAIRSIPFGPFEVLFALGVAAAAVAEGLVAGIAVLARTIGTRLARKKPHYQRSIAGKPLTALEESGKQLDPADRGRQLTRAGRAEWQHGAAEPFRVPATSEQDQAHRR